MFLSFSAVAVEGQTIRGQVHRSPGEIVTNVRLTLGPVPSAYERALQWLGRDSDQRELDASLDAAGWFTFELGGSKGTSGTDRRSDPQRIRFSATNDDWLPVERWLVVKSDAREVGTLTPQRARRIEVRTLDSRGVPVAGAIVRGRAALHAGGAQRFDSGWMVPERFARTDDQGRALLLAGSAEGLEIEALATSGHGYGAVRPSADDDTVEIRLKVVLEGAVRRGSVRALDAEGRSLRDVAVVLRAAGDQAGALGLPLGLTGKEGTLELVLPPGAALELLSEDSRGSGIWPPIQDSSRRPTELRVPLHEEPVLTGQVVDGETGKGLADAWVSYPGSGGFLAESGPRRRPALAWTDAEGNYALRGPIRGQNTHLPATLMAGASGYAERRIVASSWGWEDVGPLIELERGVVVSGVVRDAAGEPVAEAEVQLAETAGQFPYEGSSSRPVRARSGTGGEFRLPAFALPDDRQPVLSVKATGHPPWESKQTLPERGALEVEVILDGGRRLTGIVLGEGGEPVPGAAVYWVRQVPDGMMIGMFWQRRFQAATSSEGAFALDGLPPSSGYLKVVAPQYEVKVIDGIELEGVGVEHDLDVLYLRKGVVLEGVVRDARETAVPGVAIELQLDSRLARFGRLNSGMSRSGNNVTVGYDSENRTDERGRFRIGGLTHGSAVTLTFTADGYVDERVPVARIVDGMEPFEIVLPRGGVVRGKLIDETRASVRGSASLRRGEAAAVGGSVLAGGTSFPRTAQSGPDGVFEITGIAPGTYHLRAGGRGFAEAEGPLLVVLAAGSTDVGEIVLQRGANVEGTVTDSHGNPLRATVSYSTHPNTRRGAWTTDERGRYRARDLPFGRVRLNAVREGGAGLHSQWTELEPGLNRVDLVIEGRRIAGVVIGPDGAPVTGARVSHQGWGVFHAVKTSSAGRFELVDLLPGEYRLQSRRAGLWLPEPVVVELGESDVLDVVIELTGTATILARVLGLDDRELEQVSVGARGTIAGWPRPLGDGLFEIDNVGLGKVTVVASLHNGGREARAEIEVREIEAPVEVEVVFSEEGYRLVGTVLLEGEPVPEAHIRLERDGGSFPRGAVTDYRGSFVFEGVAAGAYLLSGVLITSARLESPRFQIDSDRVVVMRVDQLGNVTLD